MNDLMTLLALGGAIFWALTITWIIAMFWCVEKENGIASGVWFVLYLVFLYFIATDFILNLIHKPLLLLSYIFGYIGIGFVWSFAKWWLFVNKRALVYKQVRMKFIQDHKGENITLNTPMPENLLKEWKNSFDYRTNEKPLVHKYSKLISLWIVYWPFSLIWSIINDFIKKSIRILVIKIQIVYNSITNGAFKE